MVLALALSLLTPIFPALGGGSCPGLEEAPPSPEALFRGVPDRIRKLLPHLSLLAAPSKPFGLDAPRDPKELEAVVAAEHALLDFEGMVGGS